jgi:formate dehydrogenase
MRSVTSFCRICESLCGIVAEVDDDGKIVRIRGDEEHPVSKGYLCPKGAAIAKVVDDPDRVRQPLRRRAGGAPGEFEPVSWDEALDDIAARLTRLRDERGPNSIALYMGNPNVFSTGSLLWTKRFIHEIGTPHFYQSGPHDTFGRHTVSAFLYGSVMAFPMPDIPRTEYLLMFGANPLVSQGSLISMPGIRDELNDVIARGGRIVVVDPVRTRTAETYEHVSIRPGADAWLAGALLNVIFAEGLADRATATSQAVGLDQLERAVSQITPELASEVSGIAADAIRQLARDFANATSAVAYSRVGLNRNPNGTIAIALVDALNIVTGNYDRPGGWIWGDPPIDFIEIGAKMGMDTIGKYRTRIGDLPDIGGMLPWVLVEEMTTPGDGQVRALFTVAGNPALSAPGGDAFVEAIENLDLLVSLDLYVTETSRHADYVLPATTFLEHADGFTAFMGTMPRPWIQTTRAVVEPPPDVRYD